MDARRPRPCVVDLNNKGVPGIFVQDFIPDRDTGGTRRPLGGFDSDRLTETFGVSPTGGRLAISSTENLTNIIVANDVAGITARDGAAEIDPSSGT